MTERHAAGQSGSGPRALTPAKRLRIERVGVASDEEIAKDQHRHVEKSVARVDEIAPDLVVADRPVGAEAENAVAGLHEEAAGFASERRDVVAGEARLSARDAFVTDLRPREELSRRLAGRSAVAVVERGARRVAQRYLRPSPSA